MKEKIIELNGLIESLKANPLAQKQLEIEKELLEGLSMKNLSISEIEQQIVVIMNLLKDFLIENFYKNYKNTKESLAKKEEEFLNLLKLVGNLLKSDVLGESEKNLILNQLFDGISFLSTIYLKRYKDSLKEHEDSSYSTADKNRENSNYEGYSYCIKLLKDIFKDYPEYLEKINKMIELFVEVDEKFEPIDDEEEEEKEEPRKNNGIKLGKISIH